jgi:5-methylcytosine-specific restriction endonuclease McrA
MTSFVAHNLETLSQRHYVRKAGASDYWFDFTQNKLEQYKGEFGDDFCLVLYASETDDDSYVLPYSHVKHLFADQYVDDRKRWVGSIDGNLLRVRRSNQTMSLSAYYNAFEYLEDEFRDEAPQVISEPEALYDVQDEIRLSDLRDRIRAFNETYRQVEPHKQKRISEYISRPNAITDYLKKYRNFTCQMCSEIGFIQKNGTRYIEAHHIIEIHELIAGSLCSDNIVVLCANCHRKLHYAEVAYEVEETDNIVIRINDEHFVIERNIISTDE